MACEAALGADGGLVIQADGYRLTFDPARPYATLADADGSPWLELCLAWGVDRLGAPDSTLEIARPVVAPEEATDGTREILIETSTSAWAAKRLRLRCAARWLEVGVEVEGSGDLLDVHLGGGWWAGPGRAGAGWLASGRSFGSVLAPEPGPLDRFGLDARSPASVDVMGGSLPGRGHWFFTPGPLCYGFARAATRSGELPDGPWLVAGITARLGARSFAAFGYSGGEESFTFALRYEGHTRVNRSWVSPSLVFRFGAPDAYAAIAAYRAHLAERDLLPDRRAAGGAAPAERPPWWSRPIFCGWGSQSHQAAVDLAGVGPAVPDVFAGGAPGYSRQEAYDGWLSSLETRGLVPGTIVIDDKWSLRYATNEPDTEKWPDLRAWIRDRHAAGQHVLLWWKAWDFDGLEPEQCIRTPSGRALAADPDDPVYEATLRASVRRMLGRDGLDADGFKVDFTAQTPSGPNLVRSGSRWGLELLHRLLWIVYSEAKRTKPDALVISHAVDPSFADVGDMVRLNDALRLSDPRPWAPVVPQMLHRARIVAAAMPELLIDTDDWALPDLATWRDFQRAKAGLGVPSLYYATHIDQSGEPLEESDDTLLRWLWAGGTGDPPQAPEPS